jgi:tetratricopeptide (TPR) repeat protein
MLVALSTAWGQTRGTPSPAELGGLEGQALKALRAGDFRTAIAAYQKLVRAAPQVAQFRANLCVADYSARRYPQAAVACREALKLDPGLKAPQDFLALSLAEGGDCKEALPALVKAFDATREAPMKRQLGLDGVTCAMSLGDTGHATELLNTLVETFPNDPDILYTASHVYSDLSTLLSERLLRVAPGSSRAHEFNAEVLEFQGKMQDAAAEYRKVLAIDPSAPNVHYRLGRLLLRMGDDNQTLQQAREQFEDELRVNPDNAAAEYELGQMAWRARDWNRAVEHLRRAAQDEPRSPSILVALGRAWVSAGQAQAAMAPLLTAVRLAPNDATAHYELAIALLHLGRKQQADRQMALYRRIQKAAEAGKTAIRQGIQGGGPEAPKGKPFAP